MPLKRIHEEITIKTSPERMWSVLSRYGDVSDFHAGVSRSYSVDGSENKASLGCERVCNIVDMGMHITLKERITDFVDGKSYRYEVYEWKNFPIQQMFFAFTILRSTPTHTVLGIDIEYRAKPAFLTWLMSGKVRRLSRDVLLGYKHYAETGEKRIPLTNLKRQYASQSVTEVQYGS